MRMENELIGREEELAVDAANAFCSAAIVSTRIECPLKKKVHS